MRYRIITYGCQMNEADSELMASLLARAGWKPSESHESADLVVLNTCSVRERPEHKVFSMLGELRRWKRERPGAVLVVAGCMAQRVGEEIAARSPHVDIVMGTRAFHRIGELVDRVRAGEGQVVALGLDDDPSQARGGPTAADSPSALRTFVPIIRGCSNFCSYCIVPTVRGTEVSRSLEEIAAEVESLTARGTREVTLLGQNVLAYGRDLPERPTFGALLRRLDAVEGLWRIRFTTCHPRDVDGELVRAMAELPKVCEHLHLPIQAGADRLLEQMNRGYTTARYRQTVEALRAAVPGIAITTDIMVGFPGETDEDFEQSLDLYRSLCFDAAFTFAYSPRPGTAAAEMAGQVPRAVRVERLTRLIEEQNRITVKHNAAEVGTEAEVLVDGPAPRGEGLLAGRARNDKQVIFAGAPRLAGGLVTVRLTEAHLWGFVGELIDL